MNRIEFGDCRETMRRWADQGVKAQMCVTSPPYFGLRSYLPGDHPDKPLEIGLEETPDQYVTRMVEVFHCVRDVLADDGVLWLNLGDSYGPGKQLLGVPWRVALALQADGWYLRQDIIWHKPNPMPESVRDRCTKAHEYMFLLSKSERYFFDADAIKETASENTHPRRSKAALAAIAEGVGHRVGPPGNPAPRKLAGDRQGTGFMVKSNASFDRAMAAMPETRNRRSVWTIATRPYKGAHFATFPPSLIEPCILAGSRPSDIVLDPFMGSGTTAAVALQHGRQYLGCELNPEYGPLQQERIAGAVGPLFMEAA